MSNTKKTEPPASVAAMNHLVEQWMQLEHYGKEGMIPELLRGCREYLSALTKPSRTKQEDFWPRSSIWGKPTPKERNWMVIHLSDIYFASYYIVRLIDALRQVQIAIAAKGDLLLATKVLEDHRQASRWYEELLVEVGATEEMRKMLECPNDDTCIHLLHTEPIVVQAGKPQEIRELIAVLDGKETKLLWAEDALRRLPVDALLLVQTAEPECVESFCYSSAGMKIVTHDVSFDQLTRNIFRLHRELQRGVAPAKMLDLLNWFRRNIFSSLPPTTGTVYYHGKGIFSRLPISLFRSEPTAWFHKQPFFIPPSLSPRIDGTALWCNRAPIRRLQATMDECLKLPRFRVRQATKVSVAMALMHHEPVHLALHAQACGYDKAETKLFVEDGEISIEDLHYKQLEAPIVFLSACDTAVQWLLDESKSSLAEVLVAGGVRAVIAAKWKIPDDQAMVIAEAFWKLIREGVEPIEALHLARWTLRSPHAHAFELHL